MTSNLAYTIFYNKLDNLTVKGNPAIKGSPLGVLTFNTQISKPFYGEISNSSFRVTANSNFGPIPYIIEGKFNSLDNSQTNVSFDVVKTFGHTWFKAFIGLLIILAIVMSIVQPVSYFESLFAVIVMLSMSLLGMWLLNQMKKSFIKKFCRILELVDN